MKSKLTEHSPLRHETERVSILYLALGTNLGDRKNNLDAACRLIGERIGPIIARSSDFETVPIGFESDNLFLNAAVAVETALPVEEILLLTQTMERELGRTRKSENGVHYDRTIDIDLLIYGEETCVTDRLQLPHPHLHERRFVLEPLCEIAPRLLHPTLHESMEELLKKLNQAEIHEAVADETLENVRESINRLLPQLSAHAQPLNLERLQSLLKAPNIHLYLLRDEMHEICGMATLAIDALPTGNKAWIEDVVVERSCRGRGYGRQLIEHLIEEARRLQAKSVNLTSRPEREAANRLYRSCGFMPRETNVYKLPLD